MAPIIEARWAEVQDKPLLSGAHRPDGQMCVMEMVAEGRLAAAEAAYVKQTGNVWTRFLRLSGDGAST